MPQIVVETSQQRYLASQNLTSYPVFPNPAPNLIAILKYCHKNVPVCYGCLGRFIGNGYSVHPNHMIVAWKTQKHHMNPKTQQKAKSIDFFNVYYHFHQACHYIKCRNFTKFHGMEILCKGTVSWKFPHPEIRWNYDIFHNVFVPHYSHHKH